MKSSLYKKIIRKFTPMTIEERRHAHRMILLSSIGSIIINNNIYTEDENEKYSDDISLQEQKSGKVPPVSDSAHCVILINSTLQ
jgi:hypothetical protein